MCLAFWLKALWLKVNQVVATSDNGFTLSHKEAPKGPSLSKNLKHVSGTYLVEREGSQKQVPGITFGEPRSPGHSSRPAKSVVAQNADSFCWARTGRRFYIGSKHIQPQPEGQ